MNDDEHPKEIVIIRRGGHGHDDGHHGGMWKIAYADFMTAMMALFLVLWLVNSSDEQTLAQVATYFNPIDMSDSTTTERGVHDKNQAGTGTQGEAKENQFGNTDDSTRSRNDKQQDGKADEALFSDPYDVLAKLASEVERRPQEKSGEVKSGRAKSEGKAFRDPFDPDFRFNSNRGDQTLFDLNPKYDRTPEVPSEKPHKGISPEKGKGAAEELAFKDELAEQVENAVEAAKHDPNTDQGSAAQIQNLLMLGTQQAGLSKKPGISVEKTDEGILISVTDQVDFEMFALSSAEPKPELVVLMEELAKILEKQPGQVVIRGHTDARPFRSKTYDNWRLSTARAHIARYMLLRGGLAEKRVERIEGYADTSLKKADEPHAATNRRIEILLKPEKT